jgi:hypothetical protein
VAVPKRAKSGGTLSRSPFDRVTAAECLEIKR